MGVFSTNCSCQLYYRLPKRVIFMFSLSFDSMKDQPMYALDFRGCFFVEFLWQGGGCPLYYMIYLGVFLCVGSLTIFLGC
jgi:hypothetical protein